MLIQFIQSMQFVLVKAAGLVFMASANTAYKRELVEKAQVVRNPNNRATAKTMVSI